MSTTLTTERSVCLHIAAPTILQRIHSPNSIQAELKMGNESVPIQLTQCRFPGQAISNVRILMHFQIKYTEAVLSNSTPKLLWFEITKMLIAV